MKFADADSDFDSARFIIFGAPIDVSGSHRPGCGLAPETIRAESFNFETYLYDLEVDLIQSSICDHGDFDTPSEIEKAARKIASAGKFPMAMGGEHSITPSIISGFDPEGLSVLVFDAHLDFRDSYEYDKNSHACATRRISEIIGVENVVPIGIRSICSEELEDARKAGLTYLTVDAFRENELSVLLTYLDGLLSDKIYISLDMDAIDPSFAPGVGTPEPFGLSPLMVRDIIRHFADRLVGFDVVEVCPPVDNGNTSALAAKLMRDVIGCVSKNTD